MNDKDKPSTLVEEKQALDVYLEALLKEAPEQVEVPVETPMVEEVAEPPVVVHAEREISEGRPYWGDETFQALLFKVAGLTLAVPLVELSGVQELETDKTTPMPGHIDWYLGLTDYRGRNVPVVDTAQLVLPPDRLQMLNGDPLERVRHVVYIDNGRWGLGCQEIAEVLTLTPEQVSWRSSRTKRRWLAGTVLEQMCALIDPPAFAEMLETGMEDAPDMESVAHE